MKNGAIYILIAGAVVASGCSTTEAPAGPSSIVTVAAPRVVTVTVTGTNAFFQKGQTVQLTATATLSNGFTEDRSSSAQWTSSNTAVASVSSTGVVTAGNEGDAVIRATLDGVVGERSVKIKYGSRTPDPAPGQRLPLPNEELFVRQLIQSRPDLLSRSCQPESGGTGTWELMDFIVDRLREKDLRWGYNGRRGLANDIARDEIAYHWGAGESLNSRETYSIDILGGHCGPNPQPAWFDVTALGTIWVTRGRF